MKFQNLDNLLLNVVGVFGGHRIKGVPPLQAEKAAKQLVIHVRRGKISALIMMEYRHP